MCPIINLQSIQLFWSKMDVKLWLFVFNNESARSASVCDWMVKIVVKFSQEVVIRPETDWWFIIVSQNECMLEILVLWHPAPLSSPLSDVPGVLLVISQINLISISLSLEEVFILMYFTIIVDCAVTIYFHFCFFFMLDRDACQ